MKSLIVREVSAEEFIHFMPQRLLVLPIRRALRCAGVIEGGGPIGVITRRAGSRGTHHNGVVAPRGTYTNTTSSAHKGLLESVLRIRGHLRVGSRGGGGAEVALPAVARKHGHEPRLHVVVQAEYIWGRGERVVVRICNKRKLDAN